MHASLSIRWMFGPSGPKLVVDPRITWTDGGSGSVYSLSKNQEWKFLENVLSWTNQLLDQGLGISHHAPRPRQVVASDCGARLRKTDAEFPTAAFIDESGSSPPPPNVLGPSGRNRLTEQTWFSVLMSSWRKVLFLVEEEAIPSENETTCSVLSVYFFSSLSWGVGRRARW